MVWNNIWFCLNDLLWRYDKIWLVLLSCEDLEELNGFSWIAESDLVLDLQKRKINNSSISGAHYLWKISLLQAENNTDIAPLKQKVFSCVKQECFSLDLLVIEFCVSDAVCCVYNAWIESTKRKKKKKKPVQLPLEIVYTWLWFLAKHWDEHARGPSVWLRRAGFLWFSVGNVYSSLLWFTIRMLYPEVNSICGSWSYWKIIPGLLIQSRFPSQALKSIISNCYSELSCKTWS